MCVANFDAARVELYLGASKLFNKTVFDTVYKNKDAIESALGVPLIWDRGDEKKSSRVA